MAAGGPAVHANAIKMLLAKSISTFFIKGKLVFSNGPGSLTRNSPDCTLLDNRVFDNFILANKLFAKDLRIFETFLLVSNTLCGKLVSYH